MSAVKPFRLDIPQDDLDDLAGRLDRTRWPEPAPAGGWASGVNRAWLADLVDHWRTGFDWRAQEAQLNRVPQFTTVIDGQPIHFLHVRSPEPHSTPLIVTHGWPSTVHELLGIVGPLTNPTAHGGEATDAFDVVIPSLPGFAYSRPPRSPGWDVTRIASAWAELMRRLGYERYGAQGGDLGSLISCELGRVARNHVLGVHVNALASVATATSTEELDALSKADRDQAARNEAWWRERAGYATEMSTRPQTLAYALTDSPVGQLAWNLEWYVDYDPTASDQTPVDRDAILTSTTALWLTGTAGSAARLYWESGRQWGHRPEPSGVPTGVAVFPGDHAVRGLAERTNTVIRWTEFDRGGHFAALQAPDLLVADIREFFRTVAR